MNRTLPKLLCTLTLLGAAGCLPPDDGASTAGDGEPVIGKLKFNHRVVNLTPEVFADEKSGVPRDATANIIADIDPKARQATGAADTQGPPNGPNGEGVRGTQRIGSD